MRTADQPIRISLFAPNGRMGKAIARVAAEEPGFEIDQDHGDVLVDFSAPAALDESIDRALSANVPLLVGTTGSGFLSVNKNVPSSSYNDPTSAALAKQMVDVGNNFRFDMSDQAPAAFGGTPNKGMWGDLQQFLVNGNVRATQQQLEKDASAAYGG